MKMIRRSNIRPFLLIVLSVGILLALTSDLLAQDPGDEARGAFLKSRQKAVARRPGTQVPSVNKSSEAGGKQTTQSTDQPRGQQSNQTAQTSTPGLSDQTDTQPIDSERVPLALGYTIFLVDKAMNLSRVGADHIFKAGDRIKIIVESNSRGYLYVFYQDADGKTPMIYPSHLINDGRNLIEAHEVLGIPPDDPNAVGELADLEFDNKAESMSLLLVLSRRPIDGVPIGSQLIARCPDQKEECSPPLDKDNQDKLLKLVAMKVITSKRSEGVGEKITDLERRTKGDDDSRGIGLKLRTRLPAVIKTYASLGDDVLVVECPLIQKKKSRS